MIDRRVRLWIGVDSSDKQLPTPAGLKSVGLFLQAIAETEVPIDTVIDHIKVQLVPQVKCGSPECRNWCDAPGGPAGWNAAPGGYCSTRCHEIVQRAEMTRLGQHYAPRGEKDKP